MRSTYVKGHTFLHGDDVVHNATRTNGRVEVFNDNSRVHSGEVHWDNGADSSHLEDIADQVTVL